MASHCISLRPIEFKMVALSVVKRSIETFTWPLQRHIKLLTPSNAEERWGGGGGGVANAYCELTWVYDFEISFMFSSFDDT